MQRKIQTAVLLLSLLANEGLSANDTILHNSNRVNVMVVNKVRDFDMYSKTLFARAKIKSILSKGRFIVIEANSSADMLQKITVAPYGSTRMAILKMDIHLSVSAMKNSVIKPSVIALKQITWRNCLHSAMLIPR